MSKNRVILFLVLTAVGLAGLGTVHFEKNRQAKLIAKHKLQYQEKNAEFFELYEKWCNLSPYEQRKVRINFKKQNDNAAQEEIKQEQYARLMADLPELAWNIKEPPILADLLYGDNWKVEVENYRTKQRKLSSVEAMSITFIASSLIVALGYASKRTAGRFGWSLKRFHKTDAHCEDQTEPARQDSEEDTVETVEEKDDSSPLVNPRRRKDDYDVDIGFRNIGQKQKSVDPKKLQKALGIQATNFGEDISQLGQSWQKPEMATAMATEPVNDSLTELTHEVSAIREFAAQQQDRVRQYQEGYEWTIIKRFCIRIIRCVDHIEEQIKQAHQEGVATEHLEDTRDELIFALESSGVEQFAPETNSDYRGQEKLAEAIREKVENDNSELSGKIAEIIRYGYQYSLSEDDIKTVRVAQVKLYC